MTRGGFLLNNEMTDFSFRATRTVYQLQIGLNPANAPGHLWHQPLFSKSDKPYLVIGSPGGSRIIGYVAKAIIAYVDWGMTVQQAVSMPHLINRFGTFDLEENTKAEIMEGPAFYRWI